MEEQQPQQIHSLDENQQRTVRALMGEHDEHMREAHATRAAIAALARVYAKVEGLPVDRVNFSRGPAGAVRLEITPEPEQPPEPEESPDEVEGKEEEDGDALQDIA